MDHLKENLSNEQYIRGLHEADETVLKSVFADFRPRVVRAVTALGGSEAAGKAFFSMAILEAARQAPKDGLSSELSFSEYLKALALAHYKDWLAEREQPVSEEEPATDHSTASDLAVVPPVEMLRETRKKIADWKKGEQTDDENYPLWQKLQSIERKMADSEQVKPKNNFARNLVIIFALLTLGYIVYAWFSCTKTPAEVYDGNFSPPESLVADLAMRYGPKRGNDSVSARPNKCEFMLREADEFYKAKDYVSAEAHLYQILEDSLAVCQSDALFYIGIIALAKEEPGLALECFSKIEDLEHFGEDIYWYQALAFVKLAEMNPLLREKAARAVERARSNAQDSLRRHQTELMLKHLGAWD